MKRGLLHGLLSAALLVQMVPAASAQAAAPKTVQFTRNLSATAKADAIAKATEARNATLATARGPQGKAGSVASDELKYFKSQPLSTIGAPYADGDIVRALVEVDARSAAEVAISGNRKLTQMATAEVESLKTAALDKVREVQPAAVNLGAQVRQQYGLLVAGFSVEVPYGHVEALKQLPGVKNVTLVNKYETENKYSGSLIGAAALHAQGLDGTGTVIAIVDTGINYTHEAFGSQTALDPNGKVIGGWNFADNDADVLAAPGTSPHGTHVAGSAAASVGPFAGVAPGAKLLAQKVFSNNPEFGSAYGDDILAAIEDSIQDTRGNTSLPAQRRHPKADVINMSLGSPSGWVDPNDGGVRGVQQAVAAGVVVSISAGNSAYSTEKVLNPLYWNQDISTLGSPSVTPGSISVAASHNNVVYLQGGSFTADAKDSTNASVDLSSLSGKLLTTDSDSPKPWSTLGTSAYNLVAVSNFGCNASDVPASVSGNVALVSRGTCNFQVKVEKAAAKGAVAVLIFNNQPDSTGTLSMAVTPATVPAAMVMNSVGTLFRSTLNAGGTVSASFNGPQISLEVPGLVVDTMTTFSSWGTAPDLSPKPDVTAPGQNIMSPTWAPNTYENFAGTSMAAPHVAGASALLKQAHPDWGPTEIKLALMNTAKVLMQGLVPYSPRQQGAGRIQLEQAASTPVLAKAKTGLGIGTGHLALGQVAPNSVTSFAFELRNQSNAPVTYTLPAATKVYRPKSLLTYLNALADEAWTGAVVTFDSTSVTVPANGITNVIGKLNLTAASLHTMGLYGHFAETFVNLTAPGAPDLHLPLQAYVGNWASIPVIDGDAADDNCHICQTGLYSPAFPYLYQLGVDYTNKNYAQSAIAISPNGDGSQDEVYPVLTFLRNAKSVTIDVKSPTGGTIKRLGNQTLVRNLHSTVSGSSALVYSSWDGTVYNTVTGKYDPVADGQYSVQVKAMPATGIVPQTYTFPVKVDTVAPTLSIPTGGVTYTDPNTVMVNWTASDTNSGLWGNVLVVNGKAGKVTSPTQTSAAVDLSNSPVGAAVELTVVSFDNAGNASAVGGSFVSANEPLVVWPETYMVHPGAIIKFQLLNTAVSSVAWSLDAGATTGTAALTATDAVVTLPGDLANADHTLVLTVSDAAGPIRTYTVAMNSDDKAPLLQMHSPQQKQWFGSADVLYDFTTDADAKVLVDGVAVKPGSKVHYTDGTKAVQIDAVNAHGLVTHRAVSFYVDTTPPVVTLNGVSANGVVTTEEATYHLTGTVKDAVLPYSLRINGSVVYEEGNMGVESVPYAFDWPVDLTAGDNQVTIEAKDDLGNTYKKTIMVKRTAATLTALKVDRELFSPALTAVKANVILSGRAILTLQVQDADGLLVRQLFTGGKVSGTYSYLWNGRNTANQVVPDGAYTIVATTGTGGHMTQTVTVDSTKPVVTIETPTANQKIEVNNLSVSVFSVDADSIKLTLSGPANSTVTMAPVDGDPGRFTAALTLTKDGSYTATAVATDAAGNQQTTKVSFTVDLPPVLTASGAATIMSKAKTVTVSGIADQRLASIAVTVLGATEGVDYTVKKTVANTSWTATLTFMADGIHAVQVTGTDTTAHLSVAPITRTILVDSTAPVVTDHVVDLVAGKLFVTLSDVVSGVKPGTVKVKVGSSILTATLVSADSGTGDYVYAVNLPTAAGTYKVYVTAQDQAGNMKLYPVASSPDFTITKN